MVKVLFILHKLPDMDASTFRGYWKHTHGPLAAKLPGLLRYSQNHPYADPHGDPLPADGVDELEFESIEAMQSALATPEGQEMLADVRKFLDTERSGPIVIEEHFEVV